MEQLIHAAEKMGVAVTQEQGCRLEEFQALLLEQNKQMNLTRITDLNEIRVKHFLDSLTLLPFLPDGGSVVDVGTGAGFPGIPLAIMRPDTSVTLLDSLQKRVDFLRHVAETLELPNVTLIHSRAEEAGQDSRYRERFDTAVSRAVASLPVLSELCLPFVKPGGYFYAMKGPDPRHELEEARVAIGTLGGGPAEPVSVELPDAGITHSIIIISKIMQTPARYPRRPAKIKKSPIKG